jgi:VanZ family protein
MFFRHVVWALAWAVIVGFLYLLPGRDVPDVDFWDLFEADKFAHVAVFALLTLFTKTGLMRQTASARLRQYSTLYALTGGLIYGTSLELVQGWFVDGRYTEVGDFIANGIGCLLGIVIYRIIYGKVVPA